MNEKWHPEIVTAILTGANVKDTADQLIKDKQQELSEFERRIKEQIENSKLLTAGLRMPEGTAARRMADTIVAEMAKDYPDAARKADENIEYQRKMNELDVEILLRKDGYERK